MRYNEKVQDYNKEIITFPGNLIAKMFGFEKKTYFEIQDDSARNAPEIGKDLNF
jgi:LemA protein